MNLYSLKHISHQIDGKLIFSDVSEVINSGEIVEIRGKNGSGKTTLLKIITGIINCKNIDSGTMTLDHVSYLGHKNGLIEEITLRQNFEILGMEVEKGLFKKFETSREKGVTSLINNFLVELLVSFVSRFKPLCCHQGRTIKVNNPRITANENLCKLIIG